MGRVNCSLCGKEYFKDTRHINENLKLGHKFYCSSLCQSLSKNKGKEYQCENLKCNKFFKTIARKCYRCNKRFYERRKYCSDECIPKVKIISSNEIINQIKNFCDKYDRIPLKREFPHYNAARDRFGNWNNAIKAAGFKPNPVMFADKCIANDGHICDSIAERIIDDYLFEKGITHQRNISYPEGVYTADFKIGNKLIEYFGLAGEHKRYDELRRIKQRIARRLKLELIEIYPKDLYPHNKLDIVLSL